MALADESEYFVGGERPRPWEPVADWCDLRLSRLSIDWFFWIPAGMIGGILLYFRMQKDWDEVVPVVVILSLLGIWGWRQGQFFFRVLGGGLVLLCAGFMIAGWHGDRIPADIEQLGKRPVEIMGEVETLSLRPNGTVRLVIRNVVHEKLSRPVRIRVTIARSQLGDVDIADLPGQGVSGLFKLRSPPRPVIPGGRDSGRDFWFWGIDATGFSLAPVVWSPAGTKADLMTKGRRLILKTRFALIDHIRKSEGLSEEAAGVAMALIAGERGSIPFSSLNDMRASGLAHLLAISGLHMALVAGGLYGGARFILALFPSIVLRFPIKKIAAFVGMMGGAVYLGLSGASVATERAFIMACVGFLAILSDRQVLSMRTVVFSAVIIIFFQPLAVLSPGFQMSFAAVAALIAAHERIWTPLRIWWLDYQGGERDRSFFSRGFGFVLGIALTSLIAGLATAPFALYHFQQTAHFGVLANMLAMPVMTLWTMPFAILSVLTMLMGLDYWPLVAMGQGIDLILIIANWVAGLPASSSALPVMPDFSLFLVVLSLLVVLGSRGRLVLVALVPLGLAIGGYLIAPQPIVMIEEQGRSVLRYDEETHIALFSRSKMSRYTRKIWLQRLGAPIVNMGDRQWQCDTNGCSIELEAGGRLVHGQNPAMLAEDCTQATILVVDYPIKRSRGKKVGCSGPDLVIDRYDLWRNGAYAIYDQVAYHQASWANALDDSGIKWLRALVTPLVFEATTDRQMDLPSGRAPGPTGKGRTGLGENRYVVTHVRGERGHHLWSPDPLNGP